MSANDWIDVSVAIDTGTATHVGAPARVALHGKGADVLLLDALNGAARVIAIADPRQVAIAELAAANVKAGERILVKTRDRAVGLTLEAARWLASRAVKTVGLDVLAQAEIHRALIDAGVWLIEGLDLSRVPDGPCELMCLPLKLAGGDGAPARAFVRPKKHPGRGTAW